MLLFDALRLVSSLFDEESFHLGHHAIDFRGRHMEAFGLCLQHFAIDLAQRTTLEGISHLVIELRTIDAQLIGKGRR